MKNALKELKTLPIEEGLELVLKVISTNEVLLFKSQLADLKKNERLSLLLPNELQVWRNKLQNNWLEQIDLFSDEEIQKIASQSYIGVSPNEFFHKLGVASLELYNWESTFANTTQFHIERKETSQLLEWIELPLTRDEKGIVLLVGEAGMGKSVILHDILHTLNQQKVPVLGIKADRYCVDSIHALEKRLHLNEGIEEMIRALSRTNERVVILIDQIDALSQALSARREYLDTFNKLVALLADISNLRIVISCRAFDLQHDHDFSHYRQQKHFKVGKLEEAEVTSVLKRLLDKMPGLPLNLQELLRTPLHLNVFCQIYHPDFLFEKIKALRDLYDELWLQKVVKIQAPVEKKLAAGRCPQLIFELADAMYENQNLEVSAKTFKERFFEELRDLESEGIIQETQDGLAFFHQTFYDFAFAKQFTQKSRSIEEYLIENGQSLHIRACLKMMMEFLREQPDPQDYLRVYKAILPSPKYYFHIKSLLLSVLGFVKKPSVAEKQLVRDLVLPEPSLFKAFIAAVNSREWLLFLLAEKQLELPLQSEQSKLTANDKNLEQERSSSRAELLNGLLSRHLPECQAEVLDFLWNLPQVDHKKWLVQNALQKLEVWDNLLAFKLYDDFPMEMNHVFFDDLMKKAALKKTVWAMAHLKAAIGKQLDSAPSPYGELEFEYSLAKLIEYFAETYPEQTFDILLEAQTRRLFTPESAEVKIDISPIVVDLPWFSFSMGDGRHDSNGLFSLLLSCARNLAKKESPRFKQFINESLNRNSATILLVLVEGFRANPAAYISDIAALFKIFLEKLGFDTTQNLAWRTRQLLKEAYPFFGDLQKLHIIQEIAQIESSYEKQRAIDSSEERWVGYTRYVWLKYLPESDLAQIPGLELSFRELEHRFPKFEDEKPNRIRSYRVGPPLSEEEYSTMTLSEWKSSFSRYNEKFEREPGSEKGGTQEHAHKFEEEIKKRPDFFFPLIEELTGKRDLSKEYLIHGLRGLQEAKYSPERLIELFKKIEIVNWEESDMHWLVSLCGYFVNEKIEDEFFLHFLIQIATTNVDPKDESLKVLTHKDETEFIDISDINSVRGSATRLLPYCYYFKSYENLLFETLENIAEHDLLSVRCQVMPGLALLNNLDKELTLKLFLRLIRDNEEVVMKHSAWTAQYLTRYDFARMRPYFENALAHPNLHDEMATILALTWIYQQEDALILLNQFIEQNDDAKSGAIEVAAQNIQDQNGQPIEKSLELFARFLEDSGETVIDAYDSAFRHLKSSDFPLLQPILVRFAKTVAARKNPRPFYEYLNVCATKFPEECLGLVEGFSQYEKPDIRYAGYYDREPLKVVINAYNSLWGRNQKDPILLDKALRLFDKMLLDDRFRRDAETALDEVEH